MNLNQNLNTFINKCFFDQINSLKLINAYFACDKYNKIIEAVYAIYRIKGKVVAASVGKSGIVARKFAETLSSTDTESVFLHGYEASHRDLGIINKNDLVFLVS